MLIKRTVRIVLVHDKHFTLLRVVTEEHVNMVTILTFRTADIPVRVVHGALPLFAGSIPASSYRAFRLLNRNLQPVNPDMPLLVVARLLLGIGRLGIHPALRFSDTLLRGVAVSPGLYLFCCLCSRAIVSTRAASLRGSSFSSFCASSPVSSLFRMQYLRASFT